MASNEKEDNCLNAIEIDYKKLFKQLVINIDSHKGQTINKPIIKQWINQFDKQFSDKIDSRLKSSKISSKSMGNIVNRNKVDSTHISNDNLFTTNLSPIKKVRDNVENVDYSCHSDEEVIDSQQNDGIITQEISDDLTEETIDKQSHNHNSIETRDVDIENDIISDKLSESFGRDSDDNDINGDIGIDINHQINKSSDNIQINGIKSDDNCADSDSDRSKVNSEIETELINDDNQSELLTEQKTNDNKVNDLEENTTNLLYDTNEELVYSEHNLTDTQNNTEMNNSDEDMNDRSLRPRKTVNDKSSESSDVEFNDSSDFADSSDNDSDDNDYTLSKQKTSKTANYSKYEKLLNDQRFKMIASVELIKLSENMIEESDLAELCTDINSQEIKMFDTLRSNGFLCRKQMAKSKTRPKRDEDPEDREIRRLCRIPGLNKGKKRSNRNNVSQSSEEYNSDESNQKVEKKSRTKPKKLKKCSGDESDNELDSDSIPTKKSIKANDSNPLIISTKSKKIDILDSDLSENEVLENSEKKSKTQKKSETKNINNGEHSDSEVESKPFSNTNKRIFDKVLRNANQEEKKESKPVIDLDSNSEEEVVPKKRALKRRLSDDDDYCGEGNNSEKEEEEDSDSSVALSEGMDPSLDSDSDFENESKSRRKDKKKSKSKKSEKDKEKRKKGRKRVVTEDTSDEDEVKILSGNDSEDSPNKSRKNLKKIISDKKLKQQTKDAAEAERDRRKRIIDKQKEYNDLIKSRNVKSAELKEVILEFDKKTKEPIVEVDEVLVKYLKPHQVDGIKFMYDCAIETLDQLESSPGSGCILAHSMGLGKTLQVITFLHTILSHKEINKAIKSALVICPVNTIRNWANEFKIWLNDHDLDNILVFEMNDAKTPLQRGEILNIWRKRGGVMIIGLTLFSSMVQGGRGKKPPKSVRLAIEKCLLDPGPDIAICDEGHLLKNEKTAYNKAVSKLKTLRRVVLTGTPLQNNLSEYYVMVNFVKPNLLGTKKEFTNRFANPITNGQHVDSTDYDVKIMKKRVHILHTLLNGCVHRCDYGVLVPYLQPKHEYVISVKLSELQIDLYSYYLQNLTDKQRFSLLADYGVLRLVWNHPSLLYEQHQRKIDKDTEDSIEDFIDDDDDDTPVSGDSDIECMDDNNKPSTSKFRRRVRTRFGKQESEPEEEEEKVEAKETDFFSDAWFSKFMNREESKKIELSGKFILLFSILEECEKVGDKILLFTQSLDTLDLVEELLKLKFEEYRQKTKESVPEIDLESEYMNDVTHRWMKNIDYFRLDGSTSSDYRKAWVDIFNDETNFRARLFLVSTKAGGLGINLVGANRCIIFDASWNPTHDVQAIFRVFRFGQKKPVYIYRFVAQGTMEEKIYERQIIKQSLSCRVIDEQQIQRHFKASEMSELYVFNPDKSKDRPTPVLPKDRLLAEMLMKHKDFIINYHEHDSLLENKPEEEMTEEEKQTAWNEYEQEKDGVFLREQQEQEMRRRRELLLQQQQQAFQQQQQQQQQYAQMYQQIYQNMAGNSNSAVNLETLLQQQIYQNIMKSQENIRKQQQQAYRQQMQQQMQQTQQQTQPQTQASAGLPSYGVMTIEDIAKYLKNLNNSIDSQTLVTRIFSILTNGKQTCQKEILTIQAQLEEKPRDAQLKKSYHKVAQEIQNLNLQEERARIMFKLPASRTVPNIRPNSYQFPNQPTVIEPDESSPQYSSSNPKPSSVLIEEVD